jgi:hypothetical protein
MKSGQTVPLGPPEADEYSLQSDQIKYFVLTDNRTVDPPSDPKIAPLKGTKYSDAIRAFNTERSQIKQWSETVLRKLRDTCGKYAAELASAGDSKSGGRLIKKIDSLLEVVFRHPNAFVTSAP